MITLKQLHALHWIVATGTFERAAARLSTTQSAVSKRIQELESATGVDIFDRRQRGARLTEQGEALLGLARQMLDLEMKLLDVSSGQVQPVRRLRLGVTELTSWTWLPSLVTALQRRFENLVIEPEVDMSRTLFERLCEGLVEIIIIPETFRDPGVASVTLADVENVWMARPTLVRPRGPMTLEQLARYPILAQGAKSGSGLYYDRWLKTQGVSATRSISSDSLNAMLGLTVAGLGVSYFPRQCLAPMVSAQKLEVLDVAPALPTVPYAIMYRTDRPTAFLEEVVAIASQVCDFSTQFQS